MRTFISALIAFLLLTGPASWTQTIEVRSSVGSIRVKAHVTPEIRPDCVFTMHGYGKRSKWQSRVAGPGASDAEILETAWDKVSGGGAFHETFVKIRKV